MTRNVSPVRPAIAEDLHRFYNPALFSSETYDALVALHSVEHLPKHHGLGTVGVMAHDYCCLIDGLVASTATNSDGREITTAFFTPGDIVIDCVSVFMGTPARERMVTLTPCSVLRILASDFASIFEHSHEVAEWGRLWFTSEHLRSRMRTLDMITLTAKERYLQLIERHPAIIQSAPLKMIATYLGITESSLSRIRAELP
jgi:CRP-like cAMP-binding protein